MPLRLSFIESGTVLWFCDPFGFLSYIADLCLDKIGLWKKYSLKLFLVARDNRRFGGDVEVLVGTQSLSYGNMGSMEKVLVDLCVSYKG